MKTYRTTIIVLCVMVVAIAAFFTVKALIPENSKPLQDPDDALAENLFSSNFNDINFEDVVKLEGVGDESYTVEDVNQHWLCVSNSSTIINSVNVEDIITQLSALAGKVILDENDKIDLSQYGLSPDNNYITIYFSDGSNIKIMFGDNVFNVNEKYVAIEGVNKVYSVGNTNLDRIYLNRVNLISDKVFNLPDVSRISRIKIFKNGQLDTDMAADFGSSPVVWKILEPIEAFGEADRISGQSGLINSLAAVTLSGIAEANCQDLSKYGLSTPKVTYEVTNNLRTQTLMIGNINEEGEYYCIIDGINDVYEVNSDQLAFIDATPIDYISKYVYMVNADKISTVEYELSGTAYKMEFFTDDPSNQQFLFNSRSSDDPNYELTFRDVLNGLYSITRDGIEPVAPAVKGELVFTVKYTLKDGSTTVVDLYKRDEDTSYIYLNDQYYGGYTDNTNLYGPAYFALSDMTDNVLKMLNQ